MCVTLFIEWTNIKLIPRRQGVTEVRKHNLIIFDRH